MERAMFVKILTNINEKPSEDTKTLSTFEASSNETANHENLLSVSH